MYSEFFKGNGKKYPWLYLVRWSGQAICVGQRGNQSTAYIEGIRSLPTPTSHTVDKIIFLSTKNFLLEENI